MKIKEFIKKAFFSFIWLAVLMVGIDLMTKLLIVNNLTEGQSVTLIPGFLWVTYVRNTNAAFGMGFENPVVNRVLYIVIAMLGASGLSVFYAFRYKKLTLLPRACIMLIIAGATGNLIDRLFFAVSGYAVVDWINFFDTAWWHWVFNVADACIVVAAIILIIYLIIEEVKEYKARKALKKEDDTNEKILSKEEKERLEAEQNDSESAEKPVEIEEEHKEEN